MHQPQLTKRRLKNQLAPNVKNKKSSLFLCSSTSNPGKSASYEKSHNTFCRGLEFQFFVLSCLGFVKSKVKLFFYRKKFNRGQCNKNYKLVEYSWAKLVRLFWIQAGQRSRSRSYRKRLVMPPQKLQITIAKLFMRLNKPAKFITRKNFWSSSGEVWPYFWLISLFLKVSFLQQDYISCQILPPGGTTDPRWVSKLLFCEKSQKYK